MAFFNFFFMLSNFVTAAPPETDQYPFGTPGSGEHGPTTISITWRRDFFDYVYGPVANYSILVVEESKS